MTDKRINVGIIGFGGRGTAMAKAIKAFPEEKGRHCRSFNYYNNG